MADKLYFGVPGNIQEIPYPVSGMGFDSTVDSEVTNLVSGGRSVYRAPTAYKSLNMDWRTTSGKLAHLIDMYNGQFGSGPFYMSDPTANQLNVLPARWANCWQLAHQSNGWGRPVVTTGAYPLSTDWRKAHTDRSVKFTQAAVGASVKLQGVVRTRLIRIPGKAYYLAVEGTSTGGAGIKVRGFNQGTGAWVDLTTLTTLTGVTNQVVAAGDSYTMIELDVYLPLGSTLVLKGMSLGTVDYSGVTLGTRTNLITNPSFETGVTGWTGVPSRSNSIAGRVASGSWYGQAGATTFESAKAPATAGQSYAASIFLARGASSHTAGVVPVFYDAGNVELSPPTITQTTITGIDTAQRFSGIRVAPANTTQVALRVTSTSTALTLDAALLEQSTTIGLYFDGTYADSPEFVYDWTGTAHGSTSTEQSFSPATVTWMPRGTGIGPVQFDNDAGGELVSSTIDRIGLSLSVVEVQSVESVML